MPLLPRYVSNERGALYRRCLIRQGKRETIYFPTLLQPASLLKRRGALYRPNLIGQGENETIYFPALLPTSLRCLSEGRILQNNKIGSIELMLFYKVITFNLIYCDFREFSLADLGDNYTAIELQGLVDNFFPIQLHSALLDHTHGF